MITTVDEPTSSPVEVDPNGGLFGRRSVLGGLFVLAVLTFFGVGLQAIDDALRRSEGFSAGEVAQVTPTISFTPASGWINDPDQSVPGSSVVVHKNGWQVNVTGLALQPDQTLQTWVDIYRGDGSDTTVVNTDVTEFTTSSGLSGLTWESHGATTVVAYWLVAEGTDLVVMSANGSSSSLDTVKPDLEEMATSITIEPADGTG